jgi:hypothetical protein
MELSSNVLLCAIGFGASLVCLSFLVIWRRDPSRKHDHFARTVVAVGVGLITVGAAFFIYNQNVSIAREQERSIVAQNLRRSMFQYGIIAYQLQSTRHYCYLDFVTRQNQSFDVFDCREAATFAVQAAGLVPNIDFMFNQAGRVSRVFSKSNSVAVFLLDGDAAFRARMPAVIGANLTRYLDDSSSARRNQLKSRLSLVLEDMVEKAEAVSATYCILADRLAVSWESLDETMKKLESELGLGLIYPAAIQEMAAKTNFEKSNCANIRAELKELLPATGGGNGGGN